MRQFDNRLFFAVDSCKGSHFGLDISRPIQQQLASAQPPLHLFALVDHAFDVGGKPLLATLPSANLYAGSKWAKLQAAGPTLHAMPPVESPQFGDAMERFVRHCNGRPMLSFIATNLDLQATAAHFTRFVAPLIDGIESTLLRFADTRVAAELRSCLTPDHWRKLSACALQWWIIDRRCRLTPLIENFGEKPHASGESPEFRLSQQELNCLLDAGLPDALLSTLADQLPEFLSENQGASLHALMQRVVLRARKFSIDSYPDQYALAVLAVCQGESALDDPVVNQALARRDWLAGRLASHLQELQ